METLQLSQARGFYTGGTVHLIINNQVGFTTSDPRDARSTHVLQRRRQDARSADLPRQRRRPRGGACSSTRLALKYRMQFRKDVVIDLVCYRRHGHNEADEPAATQPVMYQSHPPAPDRAPALRRAADQREACSPKPTRSGWSSSTATGSTRARPQARASLGMIGNKYTVDWSSYSQVDWTERGADRRRAATADGARRAHRQRPGGLQPAPARRADHRQPQRRCWPASCRSTGAAPRRWPTRRWSRTASRVRLTGQDSGRGTFFHRHAVLHDQNTRRAPTSRSQHIAERQPRVQVIDSVLSEEAVMGFEYGYSTTEPDALVIWEAPVRRLRQRRPGHHRPVHQLGRGEVGALLRPRAVPAARLRRRGAGAFLGAPRALPAAVRRERTCRCACPRRRRRCSTCCAGRCCSRSASRSS